VFGLPSWLIIVPVLGALVFIHELGHFASAKWFGIKVEEFGFGFPPRVFGVKFKGTIYSLNWIPLGGFVRMLGEEDPSDPRSFARQSALKRAVVLMAGSIMNLILPVIIFTIVLMLPHETLIGGDVVVTGVAPNSPAKAAGLRSGDTILSVNGNPLNTTTDLVESVSIESGNSIEIGIMRSDTVSGLSLTPDLMTFETVHLVPRVSPPKLLVVEVVTDPSKEVDLYEARTYNSSLNLGDTMTQGAIGVMIGMTNMKFATTSDPIWSALPNSVNTIWNVLVITFTSLRQGVETGTNPGILGPVGIAQVAGEGVNKLGLSWVFQFTAFLSISLAIVNILPLPPLDGGRLVFVILEMVRGGKRVSPKMEGMVHLVGFIAVVGLIVFVSFFEIQQVLEGEKLFLR
tara:strand:+ start:408 stop:1610 length:1203 start_codon:yes stop_codon:yes gene_type:complete